MRTDTNPVSGLDPLLSIDELAEYLGVPIKTIYEWRQTGRGPVCIRMGRHLKFAVSDVRDWIENQRETAIALTMIGYPIRCRCRLLTIPVPRCRPSRSLHA